MGDINSGSNWKFWRGYCGCMEPCLSVSSIRMTKAFRQGRHHYLIQAVVHQLKDFECVQAHMEPFMQKAFESGFGLELADCLDVVRSMA